MMQKIFILFCIICLQQTILKAQISVTGNTNTTPALATTYTTLNAAINAINACTISGPVIFNVNAGHIETVPTGGIILGSASLNAGLSSTNTISIQKNGSGANPLIIAFTGGSSTPNSANPNGILILNGADYVTIDGLEFRENTLNTSNPSTMEFGIGMFKLNNNDGCRFNTIKNCVISLSRINNDSAATTMAEGSVGIGLYNTTYTAATTSLVPTLAAGSNSNNKILANTISNCNTGIAMIGFIASSPYTLADQNNYIGDSSLANGNTIVNFGGGGVLNPSAAIKTSAQYACQILRNTINNNNGTGVNHNQTLRGIFCSTATSANLVISLNTISLKGGGTTQTVAPIENNAGATPSSNTVHISGNTIQNCNYSSASSGPFYGIFNTANAANLNINNNTFKNNQTNCSSGAYYLIYNTGNVQNTVNLNNNFFDSTISNNFTSATFRLIFNSGASSICTQNCNNNSFQNILFNQICSGSFSPIYISGGVGTLNIQNNQFNNLSLNFTGLGYMIYASNSTPNINVNDNSTTAQCKRTAFASTSFYGIFLGTTSTTGLKAIYNNNLVGLSINNTAGSSYGIYVSTGQGGIRQKIYNNTINGFSNSGAGLIYGIAYDNGSTDSVFNNEVMNMTGSGIVYGMSCGGTLALNAFVYNNYIHDIVSNGNTHSVYAMALVGSAAVNTHNNFRNTICNISSNGTFGQVNAIYVNGGSTFNISNNRISGLYADLSSSPNAVCGFNLNAGTNINLYYNSLYLSGSSFSTNWGSSAVLMSTSPTNIDLRNNILINNTTKVGAAFAVAHRRTGTSLTNYALTSNNNIWYASTYFYDGTNTDNTFTAYQNRVSLRDSLSFNELLKFIDTTCGSSSFLKLDSSVASAAESKAQAIAGFDFDYVANGSRSGYPKPGQINGGGTAPDIGAYEQDAIPKSLCSSINAVTINGPTAICSGQNANLLLSSIQNNLGISYQWQVSTSPTGTYTLLGVDTLQNTGNLTANRYYTCTIKCRYGGATYTTPVYTLTVNALPNVTVNSTPTNAVICNVGTVTLTASGATTYLWSPDSSLSTNNDSTTMASPLTTTTYTVVATDLNGCTTVKLRSVLVDQTPDLNGGASPSSLCAGASSNISIIDTTFGPSVQPSSYCSSGATSINDEEIYSFSLNGSTNAYNCTTVAPGPGSVLNRYSNFTTLAPLTTLRAGSTYTFNINEDECNGAPYYQFGSSIWIDYNRDGDFLDAGEQAFREESILVGPRIVSGNFTVPNSAQAGYTRLRVTIAEDIASSFLDPCMSYAYGETEDYIVNIIKVYPVAASSIIWSPSTYLNTTSGYDVVASNVLSNITYTVTATSALSCTKTKTISLSAGTTLQCLPIYSNSGSQICTGETARLSANPSGGGMPYTFNWNTGSTDSFINVSPTVNTNYTLTVSDACGQTCSTVISITVDSLPLVAITSNPSNALYCYQDTVSVTASGAQNYLWLPLVDIGNNNLATARVFPRNNTTYTVTGTDLNGCSSSATITIINDVFKTSVIKLNDSVCPGGTVSMYVIDTTLTLGSLTNSNTYCTPAANNSGGSSQTGDYINNFTFGTINNNSGDALNDYQNYNLGTNIKVGNNYSASITTNPTFNASKAMWIDYNKDGDFNDAGECIALSPNADKLTFNFSFTVPLAAVSGRTKVRIACKYNDTMNAGNACSINTFGEYEDYYVDILGYLPTQTYTYAWTPAASINNPSASTVLASPTANTVYTVSSTSPGGCNNTATITVHVSSLNTIDTISNVNCFGDSTGALVLHVLNGTGPYTASILPSTGSSVISGNTIHFSQLKANNYTIQISDSTACQTNLLRNITQNDSIHITATLSSPLCNGDSNGSISTAVNGGLAPYHYTWSNIVDTSSTLTNIGAGNYTLTVNDANLCTKTKVLTLTQVAALHIDSISSSAILCHGDSSNIVVYPSNSSLYTYAFNNSTFAANFNRVLPAGNIVVQMKDSNNCLAKDSILISQPPALQLSASINPAVLCYGDSATVQLAVNGGLSPYTGTGPYILPAGSYTLQVNDANACTQDTVITITQATPLSVTVSSNTDTLYTGDTLQLHVNSPLGSNYNYTWQGPASFVANDSNATLASGINSGGTYTAIVTDANTCTGTAGIDIFVINGIQLSPKIFLSGPFVASSNLMHDSLRVSGLIPLLEPYSSSTYNAAFPQTLSGGEQTSAAVLANSGNDAIVDWVLLELHDKNNPTQVVYTKAALLQRDGDVVSHLDGLSPVHFKYPLDDNYYVAIRHRNHLGIMTKQALALSYSSTSIDFSNPSTALYRLSDSSQNNNFAYTLSQDSCTRLLGSPTVRALYSGNTNLSISGSAYLFIRYNNAANDRLNILAIADENIAVPGYKKEDLNLDGKTKYNGFNNDRLTLLQNIGLNTNNSVYEQIPH